jgi:hypothetical protein
MLISVMTQTMLITIEGFKMTTLVIIAIQTTFYALYAYYTISFILPKTL